MVKEMPEEIPFPEELIKKMHPEQVEMMKRNLQKQSEKSMEEFEEGNFITNIVKRLPPGRPAPQLVPRDIANIGNDSLDSRRKFIFEEDSGLGPVQRHEIVGVDAILSEVDSYIQFLNNYRKLKELKVRTSPGLVLHGAPGLGKTYTARYIATSSQARTIFVNHFPRKEAKWAPQDIQVLMRLSQEYIAQKDQPILLYWDEFETIGKNREKGTQEENETLSALTSEIDGFSGKISNIILIGATNYYTFLDEALIRPGRMGHHIHFTPPSYKGKIAILKYYAEKKPHENIDFDSIGFFFIPNASPALIEETVEKAHLNSCLKNLENPENVKITGQDIANCLIKNIMGTPKEISLSEEQLLQIGIHETGHAYIARKLGEPVQLVCVMPHGYSAGKTLSMHPEDFPKSLLHLKNTLIFTYGGLVASEMFGFKEYGGQETDLEQITEIARDLVLEQGEGKSFPNINLKGFYTGEGRTQAYSMKMKEKYEKDILELARSSYNMANVMLHELGPKRLEYIAKRVIENKMVFQKDLDALIEEAWQMQ